MQKVVKELGVRKIESDACHTSFAVGIDGSSHVDGDLENHDKGGALYSMCSCHLISTSNSVTEPLAFASIYPGDAQTTAPVLTQAII